MYIARKKGIKELKEYWITMNSLNMKIHAIAYIYYWMLILFGYKACNLIFIIPKFMFLKLRTINSYLSDGVFHRFLKKR
jgi:hypothetical protein